MHLRGQIQCRGISYSSFLKRHHLTDQALPSPGRTHPRLQVHIAVDEPRSKQDTRELHNNEHFYQWQLIIILNLNSSLISTNATCAICYNMLRYNTIFYDRYKLTYYFTAASKLIVLYCSNNYIITFLTN